MRTRRAGGEASPPEPRSRWLRPRALLALVPVLAGSVMPGPLAPGTLGAGPALAGPPPTGPVVHDFTLSRWKPCPDVGTGMRCATLSVPLDYGRPDGRHIRLAISEVPATAPAGKRQGILVVNPGGPGASGLGLAGTVGAQLPPALAAQYDIVGFDPRGVGASVPSMHCDPGFFTGRRPDYVPSSPASELALEQRARTYAHDCELRYGWLLPYMTTQDTALDLDAIRQALGAAKINYLGYSYGTYIGQVYATLFPQRVRRLVLDSTVNPDGVWWQDNLDQDIAGQARIEQMFAWTARYASTYHLGTTAAQVSATYSAVRARLAKRPADGVGPDELDDSFVAGLYSDTFWTTLASALSQYVQTGSGAGLASLYASAGIQDENEFAVYNAVECTDAAWPRQWSVWDKATRQMYARAPFLAWDNTWFNAPCAFWPVKGARSPVHISGRGLPGVLMLQGTQDVATPYAGALQARAALPSARMVAVVNEGDHGQFVAFPANACVDGYVFAYLASGALPPDRGPVDARCPAAPLPQP